MIWSASILPSLSIASSTKQKSILLPVSFIRNFANYNLQSSTLNPEWDKKQYMPSFSPNNQYATNDKSNDKGNNDVVIIKELFLNIKYRSSYEKLIEKTIQKTYKFFIYSLKHMISNNWIAFCGIRSRLKPFQALAIFFMLQIKVNMQSGSILADKIEYKKVRYLVLKKWIGNAIKHFNV